MSCATAWKAMSSDEERVVSAAARLVEDARGMVADYAGHYAPLRTDQLSSLLRGGGGVPLGRGVHGHAGAHRGPVRAGGPGAGVVDRRRAEGADALAAGQGGD